MVDRLDVRVEAGSVVGLLSPSGCGKTTLIRSIAGIQVVASGDVRVLDEPAGSAQLRRRIAYMPQTLSLYSDLTAGENVRYFARIVRAGRERVIEVLEHRGPCALRSCCSVACSSTAATWPTFFS